MSLPAPARLGLLVAFLLSGCSAGPDPSRAALDDLRSQLEARILASGAEVGLYYRSLTAEGDSIVVNGDLRMHAASTMKVPVMMRVFLDEAEGLRSLEDSVEVVTTFASIVDGSLFDLPADSDSDSTLYARVGERVPMRELVDLMITWSSNLATNIVIAEVDARRVTAMLRAMGADSMDVLRGVEDLKAFQAGLSNTTTARDLGVVMAEVAQGEGFTPSAREAMLAILERQHFRENVPAGLPEGTRVANKTGWITAHNHDAAVVFPPDAPPYVLAVLVRGIEEQAEAASLVADLSRMIWLHHTHAPTD